MEYENTENGVDGEPTFTVLILVLMEYENTLTLRQLFRRQKCLNPCSNGIRKYRLSNSIKSEGPECLNPCSNGIRKYNWYYTPAIAWDRS